MVELHEDHKLSQILKSVTYCLVKRLGGEVIMPIDEVNSTPDGAIVDTVIDESGVHLVNKEKI